MMTLSIQEVLALTEGELLHGDMLTPFLGYTTDSRLVVPGNLYIPLVGKTHNGNDFIADVLKQGASWSLISDLSKIPLEENLDAKGLIFVEDTALALKKLNAFSKKSKKPFKYGKGKYFKKIGRKAGAPQKGS